MPRARRTASWAQALAPLDVISVRTPAKVALRLYGADGEIDEDACGEFERLVAGAASPHPLDRRLEQLVVKAAYQFHDAEIVVVSGWRERSGRHTAGQALDFRLKGVAPPTLASYLRGLPRAGVGIYTHPGTQFVHLDVREPSFHWIDASPPGVRWRERQMRDPGQAKRDASWTAEGDLPSP
jgi:hypothetical protein